MAFHLQQVEPRGGNFVRHKIPLRPGKVFGVGLRFFFFLVLA
jgi:hypothetical protein